MTAVPTTTAHNSSKTTTPVNIAETGVYAISQSGTPIGRLVIVGPDQHWFLNNAFQPIGSTDASCRVGIAYEQAYDVAADPAKYRDASTAVYIYANCTVPPAATRAAAPLFAGPHNTAPIDPAGPPRPRQIDPGIYAIVQDGLPVGKVASVNNPATGTIDECWTLETDPSSSAQYKKPSAVNRTIDLVFEKTAVATTMASCSLIAHCRVM